MFYNLIWQSMWNDYLSLTIFFKITIHLDIVWCFFIIPSSFTVNNYNIPNCDIDAVVWYQVVIPDGIPDPMEAAQDSSVVTGYWHLGEHEPRGGGGEEETKRFPRLPDYHACREMSINFFWSNLVYFGK